MNKIVKSSIVLSKYQTSAYGEKISGNGFDIVSNKNKRFLLRELLVGVSPKVIALLNEQTKWARDGKPVGREII